MEELIMARTEFGVNSDIRIAPEQGFTISCQVGDTGVVAGSDGRKILKAGTPVGGATNVLENRDTKLVLTTGSTDGAKAQGVILHDVDVSSGSNNATLVVAGVIDLLKLDSDVVGYIDTNVKSALKHIIFMKGAN